MEFLRHEVDFTIVAIPEALSVEQLEGTFRELGKFGLAVKRIVINNVVREKDSEFLNTKAAQQQGYLKHIHDTYSHLEIVEIPMFPREVKGLDRLREVARVLYS